MEASAPELNLLDLYCCAGGAGVGYHRAGFTVTGVDVADQPRYPYKFIQAEAIGFLREEPDLIRQTFAAVHASPPCQAHAAVSKSNQQRYGYWYNDYIRETRLWLNRIGLPYVIENVASAPVRRDIWLCGEMFGLGVIRHRHFELGGWTTDQPDHVAHRGRVRGWRHGVFYDGPYVQVYGKGGAKDVQLWGQAMGIDWTDDPRELVQAIPPAYTEWIGQRMLSWINKNPRD